MKSKSQLIKKNMLLALMMFPFSLLAANASNQLPKELPHITVVNHSKISLTPTPQGFLGGCVGGAFPDLLNPIDPNETRDISVTFVQWDFIFNNCQFQVMPTLDNWLLEIAQTCYNVKFNDTVTFTGNDWASLRCEVTHHA